MAKRSVLRYLLLAVLGSGCASSYAPPGPVVPLLAERGDLSIGANVRPALPTRGANAYVAAAPTDATRVFVEGTLTHYDGRRATDESERTMRERNHTLQIEGGAGWGTTGGRRVMEVLAGVGFGRSSAHACRRKYDLNGNYGVDCKLWVDSRSWFVRPFVQGDIGWRFRLGHIATGARISTVRYHFERLFGAPSKRTSSAVTLEPFASTSLGRSWGKVEIQLLVPLVLSSPDVRYTRVYDYGGRAEERTFRARLIETASPRFTIGIRADLGSLWRGRSAAR